jgi:hypothetical protein
LRGLLRGKRGHRHGDHKGKGQPCHGPRRALRWTCGVPVASCRESTNAIHPAFDVNRFARRRGTL